jgi:hypothetical protein
MKFHLTKTKNSESLKYCVEVRFVVGQERARSILSQCIVSIQRVFIILWHDARKPV